jgi:hypothetical protein
MTSSRRCNVQVVKVTSDDIEFTITKLDPALKVLSAKLGWYYCTKVSDREIRFILEQPYGLFLENTVLGILPNTSGKMRQRPILF